MGEEERQKKGESDRPSLFFMIALGLGILFLVLLYIFASLGNPTP